MCDRFQIIRGPAGPAGPAGPRGPEGPPGPPGPAPLVVNAAQYLVEVEADEDLIENERIRFTESFPISQFNFAVTGAENDQVTYSQATGITFEVVAKMTFAVVFNRAQTVGNTGTVAPGLRLEANPFFEVKMIGSPSQFTSPYTWIPFQEQEVTLVGIWYIKAVSGGQIFLNFSSFISGGTPNPDGVRLVGGFVSIREAQQS